MSKRPIEAKQRRKVAKALRRQALPGYFDLVQWLVDHEYAATKRQAREIILAKRVRANSHILGVKEMLVEVPDGPLGGTKVETQDTVVPHISVNLRADLVVLSA